MGGNVISSFKHLRWPLLFVLALLAFGLTGCGDGVIGSSGSSGAVSDVTTLKQDGTYQEVLTDKSGRTLTYSDTWQTAQPMGIPGVPTDGSYIELKNYVDTSGLKALPATTAELPHVSSLVPRNMFQPSQAQRTQSRKTTAGWVLALQLLSAIFWIVEIVDVARREFPTSGTKVGWVLVVVLLGCLGALIYYAFGKSQGEIPAQNG